MADPNPLRVLIADDEPLAAERLQLLLARAEGAQLVGTASDGDSAINLTEALHPDLLLLDIAMPGLDGIGTIARMRARGGLSALPVILFVNPELAPAEMEELQHSIAATAREVAVPLRPVLDVLSEGCARSATRAGPATATA